MFWMPRFKLTESNLLQSVGLQRGISVVSSFWVSNAHPRSKPFTVKGSSIGNVLLTKKLPHTNGLPLYSSQRKNYFTPSVLARPGSQTTHRGLTIRAHPVSYARLASG